MWFNTLISFLGVLCTKNLLHSFKLIIIFDIYQCTARCTINVYTRYICLSNWTSLNWRKFQLKNENWKREDIRKQNCLLTAYCWQYSRLEAAAMFTKSLEELRRLQWRKSTQTSPPLSQLYSTHLTECPYLTNFGYTMEIISEHILWHIPDNRSPNMVIQILVSKTKDIGFRKFTAP